MKLWTRPDFGNGARHAMTTLVLRKQFMMFQHCLLNGTDPRSPGLRVPARRTGLLLACAVLMLAGLRPVRADDDKKSDPAVPLFNGTDLSGWEQKGGKATYTIENGEIVGTSVADTPNSFLCTARPYQNFILDLDVKVDPALNSGIQIRSHQFPESKTYEYTDSTGQARKATVNSGRVHGYQVEIDPSARAWSGGIYDEGRRGWLQNLTGDAHAQARAAFKSAEWNHYRIEANGSSIKTWINGVPAADLHDAVDSDGFIALQVHSIGKNPEHAGKQVRWKNIQIQKLPAPSAQSDRPQWLRFTGKSGPGVGHQIVLISGDEEYRSEEALTQLAKILAERNGFDCTVLFSVDPQTGYVNPNVLTNIPGLQALDSAELMIIFTRFRNLPDDQMKHIDAFLTSGKPVLGIRTATHAFNPPAKGTWSHYANGYHGEQTDWVDGFGRLVLGERWYTHHGKHKHQSTRGMIAPGAEQHPVLKGIQNGEIWGSTDVYGVRLPLPGDAQPLLLGQVVNRAGQFDDKDRFYGMKESDTEAAADLNNPMMPIVWVKSYQVPGGKPGKSMTSTIGAAIDLTNPGVRKELVNGVYYLLGMADQLPEKGANVDLVGDYQPSAYGFRSKEQWTEEKKTVSDFQ